MKKAPDKMRFAAMAVDAVTFAYINGGLHVLVTPVHRPPHYINKLGFLGGLVGPKETAEEACIRVLKEKGQLKNVYTEQLYTFSGVNRDKRNRVVSVAYLCLVRPEVALAYDHDEAYFAPAQDLKNLAYDHDEMLLTALTRLRGKFSYTTIAQHLLSKRFTLTELQTLYESVLRYPLDKRNFRKKLLALEVVKDTGQVQEGVKNRPAALFEFTSKKVTELPLLG